MPKISVVLPTYNGEKYIRESIESVIQQTYTDWEMIIVDDCSTDNTAAIVEEYSKKDSRICVIHNKTNMKLPQSLNIGFAATSGKYLTWTSDDNYYHKNAFEIMKNHIDENNVYMVKADYELIDSEGNFLKNVSCDFSRLTFANNVGACFMYKREVYQTVGEYDVTLFGVEDYDYWLRIEQKFGEIECIKKILYAYRHHAGSLTETKKSLVASQLLKLRIKNIDYIIENSNCSELCTLYLELKNASVDCKYLKKILNKVPIMESVKNSFDDHFKHYIFGAGINGKNALIKFKDTVVGFIDNDTNKIGKSFEGYPVLSFSELCSLKRDDYQIIIAVDARHIYDIILQLNENNINNFIIV